jgi:hypothetical protein
MNMETELASGMFFFFKQLVNRKSPKNKIMSVKIRSALFSLSLTHNRFDYAGLD